MTNTVNFLAVDLGASGGRVMLGRWDGAHFSLEEIHRFDNGPVSILGRLHWDHLRLWSEILSGFRRYAVEHRRLPVGIGIDTWGVDYALLDRTGALLGNPYHYRDAGTNGMLEAAFARVPRAEIYRITGIQFMQLNTLYQLLARRLADDPQLDLADTLLFTPDLFSYWMTGEKRAEYTIASTSQMLDARSRTWATDLLQRLDIPTHFLPSLIEPGAVLGSLRPDVAEEVGLEQAVPVIATGSHDTANAVAAVPDLDDTSVYISSGTWSLMGIETSEPIITEQSLALDFTNEGGVANSIRVLKNVAGLWLLQESRRQWQREGEDHTWDALIALAEQAEPLRSLVNPDEPAFASPGDTPALIRDYCRRTGQPVPDTVGAVVRCILESLALKYRWVLGSLETLVGHRLNTIRIVGGGSQNRLLNQFTADACNRPVVTGPVEATALGNVMMQAIATGHLESVAAGRAALADSFPRTFYEPHPSEAWDQAYERFLALS
ncbi:MAG: rhamnulokinase [Caldilineae bacterium]|nr:MAG: rhamnulokinase [Caldilineae bacterium]